ncbi:hypothetical protein MTIM_53100 [Mycobacterium timonense]|uniref:Uncharacterized protein n=1 Tax=Mycobacterium timonense TaxID=701043 RepID=A0A7I9Z3S4_9MYCO|nr:hypothetical protein MTIM_14990 [Mycobacterium timonense]GFG99431.1 hypothetical protein MTIM_53100 [Mycobacterium timonense]
MTVTFGSPATVTLSTSPPVSSNANSCAAYSGTPVAVSTFGLPVSKFSRGSAARVTMNRVPDVSILKRIVPLFLS